MLPSLQVKLRVMEITQDPDSGKQAPSPSAEREPKTVLLLNANAAGGRAAGYKRAIEQHTAALPRRPMLFVSREAQTAIRLINALPAGSRVIVFGGDGSVNQLLPSLLAGGHTLGVVAVGSGNDTARALGVDRMKWHVALDHALQSAPEKIDLGEVSYTNARGFTQSKLFISSFCAGFDAATVQQAQSLPTWLGGMPRYVLATLIMLSTLDSFDLHISIEGQAIHAGPVLLASALNSATYGGGMQIAPSAMIDDGALDLMVAERMGVLRVLSLLPRMLLGRHLGEPGVIHQCFGNLLIKAQQPVPMAVDGEYLGEAIEAKVSIKPAQLPVLRAQSSPH
ncbi:MAG: diacylglycerol/lipid kinase family protein [Burkholderiaceae bacterium]